MATDIEIAQAARLQPIEAIAERLGVPAQALYRYGPHKAKLDLDWLGDLADRPDGRLILVTAITPTPAGESQGRIQAIAGQASVDWGRSGLV